MQVYDALDAAGAAGSHPGLVLLYAPDFDRFAPAYPLHDRDLVIGRDEASGICVPGGAVSRQHARIHHRAGHWLLTDLGGRNGTIVGGVFVDEIALAHLDEIRVGDVIFKFVASDAEGYARYRIDDAVIDPASGEARPQLAHPRLIGGYQIRRLAAGLREIAKSALSVMLLGESGVGKEVLALELHDWSGRTGPLVAVNCAAIPAALIEGELFGHKKGAFSGADRDRAGLVRAAHGGTLFLDEIGDMPLEAQAKLLRVIQTKEVVPLGSTQPERVDLRVVCATHRDLYRLQEEGAFRGDLLARLNEYPVTIPPLRERKEDLLALCQALAARHGQPDVEVTVPFMVALLHYNFPFNVRELEALIKRWAALDDGAVLDVRHLSDPMKERMKGYGCRAGPPPVLPPSVQPPLGSQPPSAPAARATRRRRGVPTAEELRAILAAHRGNLAAAGRELGKDRAQVHRWARRYGIDLDEFR
jgi:transcriptional regulator with GAF, ATPase, and Fis domain